MEIATTTGVVRVINERAVYDLVRTLGQVSAAQVATDTGLSRPTVAVALANLHAAGLLRQNGRRTGGMGRAPRVYEPEPDAGRVAVVDVGRSWVRVALADLGGTVVLRQDRKARSRTAQGLIDQIADACRDLATQDGRSWDEITHTVIGTPGVYDQVTGTMRLSPNLPGWERPGVGHLLLERLGPEVTICNDINLAARGEVAYGFGRDVSDLVYLSLGTGVGMGLVLDGRLRHGAHGAAGEIGFLPLFVDRAGKEGTTTISAADRRRRGALETLVGADAILESARAHHLYPDSVNDVFAEARKGQRAALAVVDELCDHLAQAVGAVVSVVDPRLIVIGGGIGRSSDLLIPRVRERLTRLVPLTVPDIVTSQLGADAVLLGGIATGLEIAQVRVFQRAGLAGA